MGLSIWHLLVVLAIALVIFGTKKLRDFGGDLGGAIKNFKSSVKDEDADQNATPAAKGQRKIVKHPGKPIEGKVTAKHTSRPKKKV